MSRKNPTWKTLPELRGSRLRSSCATQPVIFFLHFLFFCINHKTNVKQHSKKGRPVPKICARLSSRQREDNYLPSLCIVLEGKQRLKLQHFYGSKEDKKVTQRLLINPPSGGMSDNDTGEHVFGPRQMTWSHRGKVTQASWCAICPVFLDRNGSLHKPYLEHFGRKAKNELLPSKSDH